MRRPRPVDQVCRPSSGLRVESVRRKEEARRSDWRSTSWSMDDPEEQEGGGSEDEDSEGSVWGIDAGVDADGGVGGCREEEATDCGNEGEG